MVVLLTFVVLGGGAYAATQLPKNSVGTKQLKKNAVKGSKVADRSLTAIDIGGPVDSATSASSADRASNADHATSAATANHATDADRAANADRLDDLDSSAFQLVPKVKTEKPEATKGGKTDFTPDVTGLSVLVLNYDVPTVLAPEKPGEPSFPGGVEGQRLTIVSVDELAIFVDQPDLKFVGATWSGEKGDNVTLVLANGVWRETTRANF
jgi:hypothetical protein